MQYFFLELLAYALIYALVGLAIGYSLYKASGKDLIRSRILFWGSIGGALSGAYIIFSAKFPISVNLGFPLLIFCLSIGVTPLKRGILVAAGASIGWLLWLVVSYFFSSVSPKVLTLYYYFHSVLSYYIINLAALTASWTELETKGPVSGQV